MSKLLQLIGSILALCCTLVAAAAAPAVSPVAGSDAVLALHAQTEGELQLQYIRDTPGRDAETISLGIARNYHYLADSVSRRVYDYPLHRIFTERMGHGFTNDSLYAEAWFRVMELENRVRLRKALQAAGIASDKVEAAVDPFWAETELGVSARDWPRPTLQHLDDGGRSRWLLNGQEVAAVRYDAEPVPESIRGGLRRFWATVVHVHPEIADELAASGRVPQELWVTAKVAGKDPVVTHWKLANRHWDPMARYPLAPHLAAEPTTSAGAYPELFSVLSRNIADRKTPPSQDTYAARVDAAIKRGAGLEALLWITEMTLAEGRPPGACTPGDTRLFCTLAAQAGPLARSDPRMTVAFATQSPDLADRPQFDSLPNAYMLRLLWATRPPGKGVTRAESERGLLSAAQASPIANYCKDAGDFYAAAWQPFAAWQMWDLGRLMTGHTADDLLHQIDGLEDQLFINEPSLF